MKRIGDPWVPGRPYRDRIGVYGLLVGRDGRLLCVHQRGEDAEEMQLPGGGVDPGEPPIRALHREVREETGWVIGAPRRIATFQSYTWLWDYRYWSRKVHMIYHARVVRRAGPPLEAGHTPHWLAPEAAARRLDVPGDREMVLRAMAMGLIRASPGLRESAPSTALLARRPIARERAGPGGRENRARQWAGGRNPGLTPRGEGGAEGARVPRGRGGSV